jgi:hypothetical protein
VTRLRTAIEACCSSIAAAHPPWTFKTEHFRSDEHPFAQLIIHPAKAGRGGVAWSINPIVGVRIHRVERLRTRLFGKGLSGFPSIWFSMISEVPGYREPGAPSSIWEDYPFHPKPPYVRLIDEIDGIDGIDGMFAKVFDDAVNLLSAKFDLSSEEALLTNLQVLDSPGTSLNQTSGITHCLARILLGDFEFVENLRTRERSQWIEDIITALPELKRRFAETGAVDGKVVVARRGPKAVKDALPVHWRRPFAGYDTIIKQMLRLYDPGPGGQLPQPDVFKGFGPPKFKNDAMGRYGQRSLYASLVFAHRGETESAALHLWQGTTRLLYDTHFLLLRRRSLPPADLKKRHRLSLDGAVRVAIQAIAVGHLDGARDYASLLLDCISSTDLVLGDGARSKDDPEHRYAALGLRILSDWLGRSVNLPDRGRIPDVPAWLDLAMHWRDPDPQRVRSLLLAACDARRELIGNGIDETDRRSCEFHRPFEALYPAEIFAVLELRTHLGLPNPALDHDVLRLPFAIQPSLAARIGGSQRDDTLIKFDRMLRKAGVVELPIMVSALGRPSVKKTRR